MNEKDLSKLFIKESLIKTQRNMVKSLTLVNASHYFVVEYLKQNNISDPRLKRMMNIGHKGIEELNELSVKIKKAIEDED